MENHMAIPQKIKNRMVIWYSHSTPDYILKGFENMEFNWDKRSVLWKLYDIDELNEEEVNK